MIVQKDACGFQCPHSCFERTFKSRITSSLWPEIGYFEKQIIQWKEYYPNLEIETQIDAQRSIAKLEIYFEVRKEKEQARAIQLLYFRIDISIRLLNRQPWISGIWCQTLEAFSGFTRVFVSWPCWSLWSFVFDMSEWKKP